MKLEISIDGRLTPLDAAGDTSIREIEPGLYSVLANGRSYEVRISNSSGEWRALIGDRVFDLVLQDPRNGNGRTNATLAHSHQDIKAPMPGKVVRFLVGEGDVVRTGQGLAVVEAMKMQNELKALRTGRVLRIAAKDGDTVTAGDVLVTLE